MPCAEADSIEVVLVDGVPRVEVDGKEVVLVDGMAVCDGMAVRDGVAAAEPEGLTVEDPLPVAGAEWVPDGVEV